MRLSFWGKKEDSLGVYASMEIDGDKVISFTEKPEHIIPSSLRHVGIYLLTKGYLEVLKATPLHHDQLEHAIDTYAKQGKATFVEIDKNTLTLTISGTYWVRKITYLRSCRALFSPKAEIAENVILQGNVYIEDGAKIYEGVCLKGPCYIGKNAIVGDDALVRGGSCIEESSVAGSYMEMTNTLLMSHSTSHSGFIGDSIIGSNCKIGAMFCSANARLDRHGVSAEVKQKKVDSNGRHLGVMVGDNVITGACVTTMPGVIIGTYSIYWPIHNSDEKCRTGCKILYGIYNNCEKEADSLTIAASFATIASFFVRE